MSDSDWNDLPMLRALSPAAVQTLGAQARRLDLGPGIDVIREGEVATSMFFLARGRAVVVRRDSAAPLADLLGPTVFGEMALVASTPRLAGVRTDTPCAIFEVHRDAVLAAAANDLRLRDTLLGFHRERLMHNVLAASPIFSQIGEARMRSLAAEFVATTVGPGTVLLEEGAPGAGLFIILRGSCEVVRKAGGGKVADLREGDLFGEISLALFDQPCTATVRTHGETVLLRLARDKFQRLIMSDLELRTRIMHLALSRLNDGGANAQQTTRPALV